MFKSAQPFALGLFLAALTILVMDARASLKEELYADEVRVHIMDNVNLGTVSITSQAGAVTIFAGNESFSVKSGQTIRVSRNGGRIEVHFGRKKIKSKFVTIEGVSGGSFLLDAPSISSQRSYSGSFEIRPRGSRSEFEIINRVPLEDYVASVVGSEYGLKDVQGAKAMAVVARTYALHAIQNGRGLLDDESSQVYRGLTHATANSRRAARETAGQILKYRNRVIDAVYSASNGGRTATNNSVWGSKPLPYLKSRKDPWDAKISPHASWSWSVDKNKLLRALSKTYGFDVREWEITEKAADGRVEEVRLRGKKSSQKISGSSFRASIARAFGGKSLRSTYFDANKRKGSFSFEGHGFGHGVGLSQWGAHGMALDGRSYTQILDFYYSGTDLERLASSSGHSDLEIPILSPLAQNSGAKSSISYSGSSRSGSHPSVREPVSLHEVSNRNTTPKENKSTKFRAESRREISAKNVWGSSKIVVSGNTGESSSSTDKSRSNKKSRSGTKKSRRVGW